MIWILVLGLAGWVLAQTLRLGDLQSKIAALDRRVKALLDRLESAPEAARETPKTPTIKPEAGQSAPVVPTPRPFPPISLHRDPETTRPATATRTRPEGPPPAQLIRTWLEENGLAWAGAGALALGGLFLVTYAAQRGIFTPPFRVFAAVVVGFLLVGAGEVLKRRSRHPQAAALAAGAGAATLYGAAWASYWLYSFIGLGAAGGSLAVVSIGLLALAFRHGEPLAILAVLGPV